MREEEREKREREMDNINTEGERRVDNERGGIFGFQSAGAPVICV